LYIFIADKRQNNVNIIFIQFHISLQYTTQQHIIDNSA